MFFLKVMEWASGLLIVAYITWQIVYPLLCGRKPFSKKAKAAKPVAVKTETTTAAPTQSTQGDKK